jgi:hypothetical protein
MFLDHIGYWLYNGRNHGAEVSIMNYSETELTGLIKFDEARRAVEAASSIDEVKNIRDKAARP